MGSTVVRGEVEGTVEFTGAETFFGKTAALLVGTNEYSNLQKILIKIVVVLVALSLILCSIVFIYLLISGKYFSNMFPYVFFIFLIKKRSMFLSKCTPHVRMYIPTFRYACIHTSVTYLCLLFTMNSTT